MDGQDHFKDFEKVYNIAGRHFATGPLINPRTALFSTLCSIISSEQLPIQNKLLGERNSDYVESLRRLFKERDFGPFLDVFDDASRSSWSYGRIVEDSTNGLSEEHKLEFMRLISDNKRCTQRFIAAKTMSERFSLNDFVNTRGYFPIVLCPDREDLLLNSRNA